MHTLTQLQTRFIVDVDNNNTKSEFNTDTAMDTPFAIELPPVPECFSKLLVNEGETSALPSQPWKEPEKLSELKKTMLKSFALDSVPDTTLIMEGGMEDSGTSDTTVIDVSIHDEGVTEEETGSGDVYSSPAHSSRLNSALSRLKEEMVDLRHLDMSLFCQLLSLNEAIQDFKTSFCDRCSDYTSSEYTCSEYASSEYSFGGSMGSRVESFSSLNEESVGGGDFRGNNENKNNCEKFAVQEDTDELAESTSSLLEQINALTRQAEADF